MKKVFFSLMLIAALAAGFTGCKKDENTSTSHSQKFSLGETNYDVKNALAITNIAGEGTDIYNAIVLCDANLNNNNGGEGRGVIIAFKGDITGGTYTLSDNETAYPKYAFTSLNITDIASFDIENIFDNGEAYIGITGSFTLEIDGDTYTITTEGIEVENVEDPTVLETSSVDYEGAPAVYELATVISGNLNNEVIATAGRTKYNLMFIETQIAAFITYSGNFIGLTSTSSFAEGLPVGEFTNNDFPIIYLEGMDINSPKFATSGNIVIAKDGDIYTIDITDATISGDNYEMHYEGTLPFFDFPF